MDKNGVFIDQSDDSYWLQLPSGQAIPLYYYDPETGNYQEEGDSTIYDRNGTPIGNATVPNEFVRKTATNPINDNGTSKVDFKSILNNVSSLFGGGSKVQTLTPVPTPKSAAVTTNTTALVVSIIGIGVVCATVVYVLKNKSSKK